MSEYRIEFFNVTNYRRIGACKANLQWYQSNKNFGLEFYIYLKG